MTKSVKPNKSEQRLVDSLGQFHRYLESPGRLIWVNFVAGIFRGLGTAVGATIVFAGLIWFLTSLVDLPVIGKSIASLEKQITNYANATQYGDEFLRLEAQLQAIQKTLVEANE